MKRSTIQSPSNPAPRTRSAFGVGKSLALSLLSLAGAFRFGEFLSSRSLLVLTYHRIIPRESWAGGQRPPNTLFIDEFEDQMAFVAGRFSVLSGDELRAVVDGSRTIPRYSLAITFDDGYENNFSHALPILQRYGLHAVFFVTTNLIGKQDQSLWFDRLDRLLSSVPPAEIFEQLQLLDPARSGAAEGEIRPYFKRLSNTRQSEILDRMEQHFGQASARNVDRVVYGLMSWEQVRAMASAGMTIGSHTASHQILAAVSPAEVRTEIVSSRRRIEEETGQACWCFAYPNGARQDFRATDELAVRDAGYRCAFTQIYGSIDGRTSRYSLPRIAIPDTGDIRIFRGYLSGIQHAVRSIVSGT
jgi:peptidoglycan/xylan/chitin deacetylase (PgdA/CDA1 family)